MLAGRKKADKTTTVTKTTSTSTRTPSSPLPQSALLHDSQVLDAVLRDEAAGGKEVWADSAYRSDEQEQSLKTSQHESQIHERAYRNKPLTEVQALGNKVGVGLMNLTYNPKSIETLIRLKVFDFDRIGAPVALADA